MPKDLKPKAPKVTLTASVNPDVLRLVDSVADDFFTSRSHVIQMMVLDWMEEHDYITHEERAEYSKGRRLYLNG